MDQDLLSKIAYRHCKDDLRKVVEAALSLTGPAKARMRSLQQQAEELAQLLRGERRSFETYLYQAVGRKVDFEEVQLVRGEGTVQYNVVAKYIIQKDTTEPMAPRFYIDLTVVPKDSEESKGIDITLNAGFLNAIGMKHGKFTQNSFSVEKLSNPADIFSWIEYLDGDFLKARRLVRPFGNGVTDMGTKNAAATADMIRSLLRDRNGWSGLGLSSSVDFGPSDGTPQGDREAAKEVAWVLGYENPDMSFSRSRTMKDLAVLAKADGFLPELKRSWRKGQEASSL